MNPDDFEKRLEIQPLQKIPAHWRQGILKVANSELVDSSNPIAKPTTWWRELLWPCPHAWAGLAAAWLVILVLNLMSGDEALTIVQKPLPPSPETMIALRQQAWILAERNEDRVAPQVKKQKLFEPGPRSGRREEFFNA